MLRRTWLGLIVVMGGLAAAPVWAQPQIPTTTDDVVILARDLVTIGANTQQESGQIVVDEAGGLAVVSRSFVTLPVFAPQLVADSLQMRGFGSGAEFFDLFTNGVTDQKSSFVVVGTGPLPIATFPILPFPAPATVIPGTANLTIKPGEILTISAGSYGDIRLRRGAQLFFEGGTYDIRSFKLGKNARVRFNGPTTLDIAEQFKAGNRSTLGPAVSTGSLNARCISINVASDRR